MAIKVTFPTGEKTVAVGGLYQWDYGQVLEIESSDIGNQIVEVHFACLGMSEAIVRSCAFTDGIGTVVIPDLCLEQSSTITAWIYEIDGTHGRTIKSITLNVTARTKPSKSHDIPQDIVDKYTELITEVNETVNALENGEVTTMKSKEAERAGYASSAGNANNATHALSTDIAAKASKTSADLSGRLLEDYYLHIGEEYDTTELPDESYFYVNNKRLNFVRIALVEPLLDRCYELGVVGIDASNKDVSIYTPLGFWSLDGTSCTVVRMKYYNLTANNADWDIWQAEAFQMSNGSSSQTAISNYQVRVTPLTKPYSYQPE